MQEEQRRRRRRRHELGAVELERQQQPSSSSFSAPVDHQQYGSRFGGSLRHPSALTPRQDARRRSRQQQQQQRGERQAISREVIGYAVEMHTSPVHGPTEAADAAAVLADHEQGGLFLEHNLYVIEKSRVEYYVGSRRRTRSNATPTTTTNDEARVIYQQRVLLRAAAAAQQTEADYTTTLVSYGEGAQQHLMQGELLMVAMADDVPEQDQDVARVVAEQMGRFAGQIVREEDPRSQRMAMFLMHVRFMRQVAGADDDIHDHAQEEDMMSELWEAMARGPPTVRVYERKH